jgi:benzil reductase ((S)-benzoin forming)
MTHAAIVTGVSKGLGAALAAALLGRGYAVIGIGRSSAPELTGDAYRFVECDLGVIERIDAAVEPALRALARSSPQSVCLVNNAAVASPVGALGGLDAIEIERSLDVNLTAVAILCNVFLRVFGDESLPRRIINVSSGAAQSTIPGGGLYCVAKAGLEMLTRVLVEDAKAPSLTAITLRPGIIDTPMQVFMRSQPADVLPSVTMFREFHDSGQLVKPEVVAMKIADQLVRAPVEQGRTYNYREL